MNSAKGLIISLLFLFWFAATVVLMIRFSSDSGTLWLVPVLLGQLFAVFGIIAVASFVSSKKRGAWFGAIFIVVGIATAGIALLKHFNVI